MGELVSLQTLSKVAGLTLDAVDLEAGTVRVVGKGDKTRAVYLTPTTTEALRAWIEVRAQVADQGERALCVALDRHTKGSGMTSRAIRYVVDSYLSDLGLKSEGISCHSLRHSAATWARAGGAKIDALADMLGHSSTDTTRVYARIVDRLSENPARFLETMLVL